jgi:hypothetical protein
MTSRPSTAAPILTVLVMLLLGGYVTAYFWLGQWRDLGPMGGGGRQLIFRVYDTHWQAKLFEPASRIEAVMANRTVRIGVKG